MKNQLLLVVAILFITSLISGCSNVFEENYNEEIYVINYKTNNTSKWTFVFINNIDNTISYIQDNAILDEYKDIVMVENEKEPYFTTPNFHLQLYKDNKLLKDIPVNKEEKIHWGTMEQHFQNLEGDWGDIESLVK